MKQVVQHHPVSWNCSDTLCSFSREHAIYLLKTRWYAWIDDQGNFLLPNKNPRFDSTISARVPDYRLGLKKCVTFFRLATGKRKNEINWFRSQVHVYYILPGTRSIQNPWYLYHSGSQISQAIQFPRRPIQAPGEAMFTSRL